MIYVSDLEELYPVNTQHGSVGGGYGGRTVLDDTSPTGDSSGWPLQPLAPAGVDACPTEVPANSSLLGIALTYRRTSCTGRDGPRLQPAAGQVAPGRH